MSIQEIYRNFKQFITEDDTLLAGLILLVGFTSFGLGRASVSEDQSHTGDSEGMSAVSEAYSAKAGVDSGTEHVSTPQVPLGNVQDGYVASKNGTKYHLPWCGSAKQIKEENKVWFATKEEAENAGYTPASNCKGI